MIIEDGTGKGPKAQVDSENYLRTHAVIQTAERHANDAHGDAYHCVFSQSPTAADDCIFYMVNSSENSLIVEGLWLGFTNADGDDPEVYIKLGDKGTRGSATALTPTNCHAGSGKAADGTFEKGADLESGSTLTGGTEIERYVFANTADHVSSHFNFEQDLILDKNETLTIWANDAQATFYVTVVFNYHLPE